MHNLRDGREVSVRAQRGWRASGVGAGTGEPSHEGQMTDDAGAEASLRVSLVLCVYVCDCEL